MLRELLFNIEDDIRKLDALTRSIKNDWEDKVSEHIAGTLGSISEESYGLTRQASFLVTAIEDCEVKLLQFLTECENTEPY